MSHHGPAPIFEQAWDAFRRAEHDLAADVSHLTHPGRYHEPQTPENPAPAATEAPEVSLSSIASDIKDSIEQGESWFGQITEKHLPAVLALAEKYENDPIVSALEKAVLPPEVGAGIAAMIESLAVKYPATPAEPAADAPAEPAAAAEPAAVAASLETR